MPARWVFALNGAHLGRLFSSTKEFYANFARRALLPFDFTARPRFTASDSVASFQFKLARAEGKSFTRASKWILEKAPAKSLFSAAISSRLREEKL
jgi:hypothetical protein